MRILITGAAGFVGAALADALATRGADVIGVDREGAAPWYGPATGRSRRLSADLTRAGALDDLMRGERRIDAMVIAAAITADRNRERRDPAGVVAVNVGAVADAVRFAAAHDIGRVLYVGSGAVYGDSAAGPNPLVEDATPLRPRSLYAITKQAGEATALRLAETFGIDLTAGRLGTCFGPFERDTGVRDTLSAPYQILRLARAGRPARLPRPGRRDWLYIRDAVAGLLAILDRRDLPHRVYNVAAGFEWSLTEWCARVAERHPAFTWSVSDPKTATVALYDAVDRAPMSLARLLADTSFRPRHDLPAAAADWLGAAPRPRPNEEDPT